MYALPLFGLKVKTSVVETEPKLLAGVVRKFLVPAPSQTAEFHTLNVNYQESSAGSVADLDRIRVSNTLHTGI